MKKTKQPKKIVSYNKSLKKQFVKDLLALVSTCAGCRVQYGGCPRNTCFHAWANDELGLSSNMAHLFWLIVLALRGDYKEEELLSDDVFTDIVADSSAKVCCLCKKKYQGFGNNALPLKDGRCCDGCNNLVIAERLKRISNKKKLKTKKRK